MAANLETEGQARNAGGPVSESDGSEGGRQGLRLLTREEVAVALQVCLRTVDRMLAEGEITPVRMRGGIVRFYMPDVVRQLTATAVTRKRARSARLMVEG